MFLDSRTGHAYDSEEEAIADIAEQIIKSTKLAAAKLERGIKGGKIPPQPWEPLSADYLKFKKILQDSNPGTPLIDTGQLSRTDRLHRTFTVIYFRGLVWYRGKLLRQVKEIERRIFEL